MKFTIHTPIWKNYSVGLAQDKLSDENEVEIDYINKDGQRIFPDKFTITREKALTYPVQKCGCHWLRIIPIRDLNIDK